MIVGEKLSSLYFLLLSSLARWDLAHSFNKISTLVIFESFQFKVGPKQFVSRFVVDCSKNPLENLIRLRFFIFDFYFS